MRYERAGLSMLQHCREWQNLVLRTGLYSPIVQCMGPSIKKCTELQYVSVIQFRCVARNVQSKRTGEPII